MLNFPPPLPMLKLNWSKSNPYIAKLRRLGYQDKKNKAYFYGSVYTLSTLYQNHHTSDCQQTLAVLFYDATQELLDSLASSVFDFSTLLFIRSRLLQRVVICISQFRSRAYDSIKLLVFSHAFVHFKIFIIHQSKKQV